MKKFIILLYLLHFIAVSFSQTETLTPLSRQPKLNTTTDALFKHKKAISRTTTLSLPFFDDFYQPEFYPDPTLWQDNFVYINPTYPKETITIGVATFDGTDEKGQPYNTSGTRVNGPADKLTSNTINLGGLTNADNVFLSFFYLSGEYGESPTAPNDLFTVQFLDTTGNWNIVWQTTVSDSAYMRQVFIKVDSGYLNNNFQFRFQSFGNLNGANDTWHLDYVKLDKNVDTLSEKNIKDMAYEFAPPSLLKNYYVMPYNQFDSTYLADTISVFVKNNFTNPTTDILDFYTAKILNNGNTIANYSGPSRDFGPNTKNEIKYSKFNIPTNITGDTITIKVDYHFDVSAEAGMPAKVLANNAVTHNQIFSNYFAYDDGSAERGYIVGDLKTGVGMDFYKMAVKYSLKKPDTLQAIKFQFFPVLPNNNLAVFSVCVWKNFNNNSIYNDSALIYKQSNLKIADLVSEYGTDTINGYYYANIKPNFLKNGATYPLIMQDTFAVGLIVDNALSLIVGFDRNNIKPQFNYYVEGNTNKWRVSQLPGTMIMNPVIGKALPGNLTPVKNNVSTSYNIKVYPNPTNNKLFVEGIKEQSLLEVYTLSGKLATQYSLSSSDYINVQELPVGMYLLKITNQNTQQTGVAKFIKSE